MLAVALALGSSLAWGISDFLGGLKSRSVALLTVLLVSQVTALILASVLVISRGEAPPGGAFLLYAALAGLSETLGVTALYERIQRAQQVGIAMTLCGVVAIAAG